MLKEAFNKIKNAWNGYKLYSTGWDAAGTGRRFWSWKTTDRGINSLISGGLKNLLVRSRSVLLNNPYAVSGVESLVSNIIGTGIRPQVKHDDPEIKQRIQDAFDQWAVEADACGLCDFYGLQSLATRAMIEGGGSLTRFRNRLPSDNLFIPLQLQLMEPEQLHISKIQIGNVNRIVNGIEFDSIGRKVAYHLFKEHPGELVFGRTNLQSVRVPASEIVQLFKPIRPGQTMGVPWLSQILLRLYDLDQYEDAELVRKKVVALFAGFITRLEDEKSKATEGVLGKLQGTTDGATVEEISAGGLHELNPGESITFSQPADVGPNFQNFLRSNLSAISAAMGTTFEQLSGDLRGVNFSSIRAGLIETRRKMEAIQKNIIVFQFCRPIYNRVIETAVLSGRLDLPGFAQNRREFLKVKWTAQGWETVDPLKAIMAIREAIELGIQSKSDAILKRGLDPDTVFKEIQNENEKLKEMGIIKGETKSVLKSEDVLLISEKEENKEKETENESSAA